MCVSIVPVVVAVIAVAVGSSGSGGSGAGEGLSGAVLVQPCWCRFLWLCH